MRAKPKALRLAEQLESWQGDVSTVAAAELRRLHALEADALRYRAIRGGLEVDPDNSSIVVSLIDNLGGETLRNEKADEAIDAAIAKAEGAAS